MKNTSNKNPQTCKLCLEKKQLCNSHIIPEFIYTPILEHSSGYVFIFGGFVWLYCVSENPKSCFKNYSLNNKDILISEINAEEINRFNYFVDSMRAKGVFEKE